MLLIFILLDLMIKHISDLKNNKIVNVPIFDYTPCARLHETNTGFSIKVIIIINYIIIILLKFKHYYVLIYYYLVHPKDYLIVDGILLLHDERITNLLDLIIFVG